MTRLLTSRQVADRLGIQPETLTKWIRTGRIAPPATRLPPGKDGKPGQYRWTEAEVAEILRGRAPAPGAPSERAQDIEALLQASQQRARRFAATIGAGQPGAGNARRP